MNCPVCNKLFNKKSGINGDKAKLLCEAVSDLLNSRVIRRIVVNNDGNMMYLKVEATYEGIDSYVVKHVSACRCNMFRCR